MAWFVAGAVVVGAGVSAYASNKASKAQGKAAEKGAAASVENTDKSIESQEKMFNQSLELQKPYREAGYDALTGLENFNQDRSQLLKDYYAGDEFAAMEQQQQRQSLKNASVTGLRGGNTQEAMTSIAPQLGSNYLNSYENSMTGLANMGMGAASQGASAANTLGAGMANQYSNLGNSLSAQYTNQGNASAQNYMNQAQNFNQSTGTLAGLFAPKAKV